MGNDLAEKTTRRLGSIYTPPDFARFLSSWAIRCHRSKVLDTGIGEGAFVFAAYRRLSELGASPVDAQHQLYGTEIDPFAFEEFSKSAKAQNMEFPHLRNADFFNSDFPSVDAIVGNPPYVRRTYIEDVSRIRQSVIGKNPEVTEKDLHRLTDLYVYFLLYALPSLKRGGKLAVITADPWLNTGYGRRLRKYLLDNFEIEHLVSFDRRVFDNAQVKPVLMLATRKKSSVGTYIQFLRVKNGLPISRLENVMEAFGADDPNLSRSCLEQKELDPADAWDKHFKVPKIYSRLSSLALMTPICQLADTRVGIQTLAKEFFVLTPEQANSAQIEPEFLAPLLQSPRYLNSPVVEHDAPPASYLFYCSKDHQELQGTSALKYIQLGETAEVQVRGKNISASGYQNKERIKRSHRKLWYDLKSSVERRGCAAILVPRLIYRTFSIVWNKAGFVPGELFIEFIPAKKDDLEIYLAILTSSVTEIMLRAHAQVYGGGTYNMNPGQFKKVPIISADKLNKNQKVRLKSAYLDYVNSERPDRSNIDENIFEILEFSAPERARILDLLDDLHVIAISSKKIGSATPELL